MLKGKTIFLTSIRAKVKNSFARGRNYLLTINYFKENIMKKVMVYVLSLFFVVMAVSTIIVPNVSADYVSGTVTVEDIPGCSSNKIVFNYDSDLTEVLLTEAIIDFTGTNVKVVRFGSVCGAPEPLIYGALKLSDQKVRVVFNPFYPL